MALITKVGGPTNTNTLQMTNRRANKPEEEVEQPASISQQLIPASESEYISSLASEMPKERQADRPMLSDESINAQLTDQMGAPFPHIQQQMDEIRRKQEEEAARLAAPATPTTAVDTAGRQQINFDTPAWKQVLTLVGGKTGFYKRTPEQQQQLIRAVEQRQKSGTIEPEPFDWKYLNDLVGGQRGVKTPTSAQATSTQALSQVQQSIQNVNINSPFPPQVDIKTGSAEEMYLGNLYSLSLKNAYSLKKQATVDAASRGMGRENLNEAYNKIDTDIFTAFQIAQNEFLNANIQRKFEAEQAERGRIFTAGEAAKQREFEKIMQSKGFEYEMFKTKYTTEQQVGIEQMRIDAAKLEAESQRLWQSNETLRQFDFQKMMQMDTQEFNMKLALFDKDTQTQILDMKQKYDALEAEKNRIFAKEERIETQSWQTLENLRGEDLQKFLLGQDIGYKEWATQFDAATQKDLQIMRDETQKLLLEDAQTFEAFQKMEDRDLQKFLSGQQLDFAKMELQYGRETAIKLQELQEKWGATQLELKHGYTKDEAEQAYQFNVAMSATNREWEDYMSTKTFEQQTILEEKRIQASYSLQSLQQTFQAAENLSDRQLNILLSDNKADLERELATMDITSREKLYFAQEEFQKFENSLDREQKDQLAQLDSKDRYALLEREMEWKGILINQEAEIQTKANEIKMAFDKEILSIETNYKWATTMMDASIQQANLTGIYTPIAGWKTDAQGNLIKDASGMPQPIYAKDKDGNPVSYTTLEKAKTMASVDLEKSKMLGYLVETDAQGNTVYVKDANGNKITTLDDRKFQQELVEFQEQKSQFQQTLDYNKQKDKQAKDTSMWSEVFKMILSDKSPTGGSVGGSIGAMLGTAVGGPVGSVIGGALGNVVGGGISSLFQ